MNSPETSEVVQQKPNIPSILPLLPIQEAVVYPFMRLSSLIVGGDLWVKMIDDTLLAQKVIALFWYEGEQNEELDLLALGKTGTAAQVLGLIRLPGGSLQLHVQGLARVRLEQVTQTEPYPLATVQVCEERVESSVELEGLARSALGLLQEVVNLAPYLSPELVSAATKVKEPGTLADCIAAMIGLKLEEQQQILDTLDVTERLRQVVSILNREKEILTVGQKAQKEMAQAQREYVLRQQLETIRRELGEQDEQEAEIDELRQQLETTKLPEETYKEAVRELERLAQMLPAAAEYTMVRTYLDWLLSLPWQISTEDILDLTKARQVLDEDHYNLDKVKQRILEYLAVRKLKPLVPGKGNLTLTGHLGKVMQESAKAALTYARSKATELEMPEDFHQKYDVHIHVPAGAIPKDGPSAGITLATALISALTKRPAHKRVAMTGEITLRGRVLAVGGIKAKILAAQRAGVCTVILPKENERDLKEVPTSAREQLHFVLVEHMDEVLPIALYPVGQGDSLSVGSS